MPQSTSTTPQQPTPTHERPGTDMPQRHPVPAPRPHTRRLAVTCCGKPMQQEGQQLVCRKCGAWTDPGTQAGGN